jgi:hypothetical protein
MLQHAYWSAAVRGRLLEVFDVGLGVLGVATILQVLVIGIANKKDLERDIALAEALSKGEAADPRVVSVRWWAT